MTAPSPSADGPWHAAGRIEIVTTGAAGRAPLAEALGEAGLVLGDGDPSADLLLIDDATEITASAVLELRRVVDGDPMIVAVMPRMIAPDTPDAPEGAWPPETAYAVLPDPRCLYVKRSVLSGLGQAATAAELGDAATAADLGSRLAALNRFGFRVATAGRSLARHPGGRQRPRHDDAPPELRAALARQLASAPAEADRLLDALAPGADGRRAIAFDLSALTPSHSGTTRLAAALVRRAATSWSDLALHVVATEAAFAAHLAGLGAAVTRVDPSDPRRFAAAIRFGQPFLWGEVEAFAARAPVLIAFLLDTIGLDCLGHAPDELDALWRFLCADADGLLFNSAFTERQFGRRFAFRPGLPRRASLHSLDLADYRATQATGAEGSGILVVGNRFPHKRLRETALALAGADLGLPITVMGLDPGAVAGVAGVRSGDLSAERVGALHAAARVVVYPSVYEGFGFPILEALAHRRPILVRDLPPYREIAAVTPEAANIHTYADDADLVARLRDPPVWIASGVETRVRTWDDAARDLRQVLDAGLAGVDRERIVRRIDLLRGRMSYMRSMTLGSRDGDATLDRLASAAGRLAQRVVATLGRRVLGLATRAPRPR